MCQEFRSAVGSELFCDRMSCYVKRYIQDVNFHVSMPANNFWGTVQHVDFYSFRFLSVSTLNIPSVLNSN